MLNRYQSLPLFFGVNSIAVLSLKAAARFMPSLHSFSSHDRRLIDGLPSTHCGHFTRGRQVAPKSLASPLCGGLPSSLRYSPWLLHEQAASRRKHQPSPLVSAPDKASLANGSLTLKIAALLAVKLQRPDHFRRAYGQLSRPLRRSDLKWTSEHGT